MVEVKKKAWKKEPFFMAKNDRLTKTVNGFIQDRV